jgi:hypothetical protein
MNCEHWAGYRCQLPKLHFKENEINRMQLGPHLKHFGYGIEAQAAFAVEEDKYVAPVWRPFSIPIRRFGLVAIRQLCK